MLAGRRGSPAGKRPSAASLYATHLLKKRCTDMRYIKEIFGHNNSKTTETCLPLGKVYTHVSTPIPAKD